MCDFEIHQAQDGTMHALVAFCDGMDTRYFVIGLPIIGYKLTTTLMAAVEASKAREGYVRTSISYSLVPLLGKPTQHDMEGLPADSANDDRHAQNDERVYSLGDVSKNRPLSYVLPSTEASQESDAKGKTSIRALARYFHLPINVAGKELGICPTVLKKICRRNGLQRWPHRKLRSIDRLLDRLQSSTSGTQAPSPYTLSSGDLSIRIEGLKRERDELCFQ